MTVISWEGIGDWLKWEAGNKDLPGSGILLFAVTKPESNGTIDVTWNVLPVESAGLVGFLYSREAGGVL